MQRCVPSFEQVDVQDFGMMTEIRYLWVSSGHYLIITYMHPIIYPHSLHILFGLTNLKEMERGHC